MRSRYLLALALLLAACASPPQAPVLDPDARVQQCTSLLGDPLYPMTLAPDVREKRLADLADARRVFDADPTDEEAIIWLGRRQAYLGRYDMAIATFTEGLRVDPGSAKLLRHRGHRYISTRQFERAVADLERAVTLVEGQPDEIEPDGMPNALNQPRSTLQTNIHYHLGLARYLLGDYAGALEAYEACLARCDNDDMTVATLYWTYLTLTRLGRTSEARRRLAGVTPEMDVIENDGYHRLLLLFRGDAPVDEVTRGDDAIQSSTTAYGLANWHLLQGDRARGRELLRQIADDPAWPAFGHIAAEADVARGM